MNITTEDKMQKTLEAEQAEFISAFKDLIIEAHMKVKEIRWVLEEEKKLTATLQRIETKLDNLDHKRVIEEGID